MIPARDEQVRRRKSSIQMAGQSAPRSHAASRSRSLAPSSMMRSRGAWVVLGRQSLTSWRETIVCPPQADPTRTR